MASLRPIRTACKTLGGHILGHPSCGGFMPTAETTLILASGNQRAAKRSLTSDARLDNEAKPWWLNQVVTQVVTPSWRTAVAMIRTGRT